MSTRQRPRAVTGEDGLARLIDLFTTQTTEIRDLKLEIQKLTIALASMPTRSEQEVALNQRVSVVAYEVAHKALEEETRAGRRDLAANIDALKATVTEMRTRQDASLTRLAPWVAIAIAAIALYLQTR